MAIARGAGTEIIRSVMMQDVDNTWQQIIVGAQDHIYTILSVVCYLHSADAYPRDVEMRIVGWDSKTAASGTVINVMAQSLNQKETFVWNDKFSIMGHTATDWGTDAMDSVADQDAIADQNGGNAQSLQIRSSGGSNDQLHVVCTFIDQNNE